MKNHILISYKPSTYSGFFFFFNFTHIFCYSDTFGQAVFVAKLAWLGNQEKKKEIVTDCLYGFQVLHAKQ